MVIDGMSEDGTYRPQSSRMMEAERWIAFGRHHYADMSLCAGTTPQLGHP